MAISVATWRKRELAPTLNSVTIRLDTDTRTVSRMTRAMITSRSEKPASTRSDRASSDGVMAIPPRLEGRPGRAGVNGATGRMVPGPDARRRPPLYRSSSTFSLHVGS